MARLLLGLFLAALSPAGLLGAELRGGVNLLALGMGRGAQPAAAMISQKQDMSVGAPDLAASEAKATQAVVDAKVTAAAVRKSSEENVKFVPLAKGEASRAKVAATTAKDALAESKAIVAATTAEANAAALTAAKEYLLEVKHHAADEAKKAAALKAKQESDAETKAAMAAAKAAEPYHQQLIRAQKIVVEYQTRAQELAAASNNLKAQAMSLSGSAEHYQLMGQTIQARQILMQAQQLMLQAETMKGEAVRLHNTALEVNGGVPAYQLAAMAAANSAAEAANPPALPPIPLPY